MRRTVSTIKLIDFLIDIQFLNYLKVTKVLFFVDKHFTKQ